MSAASRKHAMLRSDTCAVNGQTPMSAQVGTGMLTFKDCSAATLTFTLTSGSNVGQAGNIDLTRVGPTPRAVFSSEAETSLTATLRVLALVAGLLASSAVLSQGAPRNEDGTFRNSYPHATTDFGDFVRWRSERTDNVEPPGGWRIPVVAADLGALRAPSADASVTWIGHATVLLRLAGKNILVDPIFSERASPVFFAGPKRVAPLPIDVPDLPRIDVVLITHNHYDHLDELSVLRLASMPGGSPRFLVPLGLKAWFAGIGIERVEEMDWWQNAREGDTTITFVPVQHWSRRTLIDRDATLWGGWAIEGDGLRVIHLGDAGYSRDFRDIGERLGPFDLAFIPVGAYAPRWFMEAKHLDPAGAIQVRADLRARRAIGIHWGTFPMADDPPDEPPRILALERERVGIAPEAFDVMSIGETRHLEWRSSGHD